jgi:S1-C subfamily serine protease
LNIPTLLLSVALLAGGSAGAREATSTDRADMRVGDARLSLEAQAGQVLVTEATPKGYWPLSRGDVVMRVNGRSVSRPDDVLALFREGAGADCELEVLRDNKVTKFKARAADFPGLRLPKTPAPPAPPPPPAPPRRAE